ncbi:hypothetical protein KQR54_18340 [Mycobacterium gordonae]|nr:hypothetical protein [Mycobacterium gordonae]
MTIVNDIISVEAFVKAHYPSPAYTYKQTAPLKPEAATFIIGLLDDARSTETGYHTRVDRTYQVAYVGDSVADVMAKMDELSYAFMDNTLIPVNGSARYIRVESFSYSAPFQTENDKWAAIGVMPTQIREARTQGTAPLITQVTIEIEN